jgi:hypothetical protein
MKQDILDCFDSELGELIAQRWTNALKVGDTNVGQIARHDLVS